LKDENWETRANVVNAHQLNAGHRESLMGDPYPQVRRAYATSPHVTPEHLARLSRDTNKEVSTAARAALAKEHPDKVFSESVHVRHGSEPLRRARTAVEAAGGELHKKDFARHGLNEHHVAGLWGPTGHLKTEHLDRAIEQLPGTRYNVSHSGWSGVQRHSETSSRVFQLNLTDDHIGQMKQAGVYDGFRKLHQLSKQSGHPVNDHTIGWVRHTGGKTGVHIDEVQSDFGKTMRQQLEQAHQQGAGHDIPLPHLDRIGQILFHGRQPEEVVGEAFTQHLRDTGKHPVGGKLAMNTPELKAKIAGSEIPQHVYRDVPKTLGLTEKKPYGVLRTHAGRHPGQLVWSGKLHKAFERMEERERLLRTNTFEDAISKTFSGSSGKLRRPPTTHLLSDEEREIKRVERLKRLETHRIKQEAMPEYIRNQAKWAKELHERVAATPAGRHFTAAAQAVGLKASFGGREGAYVGSAGQLGAFHIGDGSAPWQVKDRIEQHFLSHSKIKKALDIMAKALPTTKAKGPFPPNRAYLRAYPDTETLIGSNQVMPDVWHHHVIMNQQGRDWKSTFHRHILSTHKDTTQEGFAYLHGYTTSDRRTDPLYVNQVRLMDESNSEHRILLHEVAAKTHGKLYSRKLVHPDDETAMKQLGRRSDFKLKLGREKTDERHLLSHVGPTIRYGLHQPKTSD